MNKMNRKDYKGFFTWQCLNRVQFPHCVYSLGTLFDFVCSVERPPLRNCDSSVPMLTRDGMEINVQCQSDLGPFISSTTDLVASGVNCDVK